MKISGLQAGSRRYPISGFFIHLFVRIMALVFSAYALYTAAAAGAPPPPEGIRGVAPGPYTNKGSEDFLLPVGIILTFLWIGFGPIGLVFNLVASIVQKIGDGSVDEDILAHLIRDAVITVGGIILFLIIRRH